MQVINYINSAFSNEEFQDENPNEDEENVTEGIESIFKNFFSRKKTIVYLDNFDLLLHKNR